MLSVIVPKKSFTFIHFHFTILKIQLLSIGLTYPKKKQIILSETFISIVIQYFILMFYGSITLVFKFDF
jgi:hypothetical protein